VQVFIRSLVHDRTTADDEGISLASNHDIILERWLSRLDDSTGLFAVSDARAAMVISACSRLGIDVPGRLGVLGVGNFRDLCDSISTTSSAICISPGGSWNGRFASPSVSPLMPASFACGPRPRPPHWKQSPTCPSLMRPGRPAFATPATSAGP